MRFFFIKIVVGVFLPVIVYSQSLTIGIYESPPFTVQEEDGSWSGISIELWNRVQSKMGIEKVTVVEVSTIPELIKQINQGIIDVGVGPTSITSPREQIIDFSHPYFYNQTGIMHEKKSNAIAYAITRIVIAIVVLVAMLYLVGFIVDKIDGDANIKNPHDGAWYALVTFTTTGYGDLVPHTPKGKFIAAVWMIASLFLLSTFTGYMASGFTVLRLDDQQSAKIAIDQCYDKKILTIKDSSSIIFLNKYALSYDVVPDLETGKLLLEQHKADLIIYDYILLHMNRDQFVVDEVPYSLEAYGLMVKSNSPLLEQMNVTILEVTSTLFWQRVLLKYLRS